MSHYIFSLVIPTYNAGIRLGKLPHYFADLRACYPCELIVVDDGSPDFPVREWQALGKLPHTRLFRLKQNRGQHYATLFGLMQATAPLAFTLDDDLPFAPKELLRLLERQQHAAADLVYAEYERAASGKLKRLGSAIMRFCLQQFAAGTSVQPSACRLLRASILPDSLPSVSFFLDILLLARSKTALGVPLELSGGKVETASRYNLWKLLRFGWVLLHHGWRQKSMPWRIKRAVR